MGTEIQSNSKRKAVLFTESIPLLILSIMFYDNFLLLNLDIIVFISLLFSLNIVALIFLYKDIKNKSKHHIINGTILFYLCLILSAVLSTQYFHGTIIKNQYSKQVICAGNLKSISTALYNYHDKYGMYPDSLLDHKYILEQCKCPADKSTDSTSYVYRGIDLAGINSPKMILVHEKRLYHSDVCNIAFTDGHVELIKAEIIKDVFEADNSERKTRGLEIKSYDLPTAIE